MTAQGAGLERRCVVAAAALAVGQVALAVSGLETIWLLSLPAVFAVGLALVPFLPAQLRAHPLALAALVAPIGTLAFDLALVGVGAVGVPYETVTVVLVLLAFVVAGAVGLRRGAGAGAGAEPVAVPWLAWAGALAAIGCTVGYAVLVNSSLPPTGNDWAKYLLYADEIRIQGHTILDNPYWLLGGLPFSEDPGLPTLYAGLLLISGGTAGDLGVGIVVLMALAALTALGTLTLLFGPRAGVVGALAFGLIPATADMSAWHGAANMLGLTPLILCLLAAGMLLRDEDPSQRWRWAGMLALGLVGVFVAHRLSALFTMGTLALVGGVFLALRPRLVLGTAARTAACAVAIGALPAVDLLRRSSEGSGLASYKNYLASKIDWTHAAEAITWPILLLAVVAVGCAVVAMVRARRVPDPALLLGLGLLVVAFGYTQAYLVHFPGFYARAIFFAPVAIALLVAAGIRVVPGRWPVAAAVAVLLVGAVPAVGVVRDSRDFYRFTDRASLRGFDVLASRMSPGDSVLADRCLSFISTWLLKAPTLAAMRLEEVGPTAELPKVADANQIMRGTPRGWALARRYRTRWLVVNPVCPGKVSLPPKGATPVYVSERVVVLRLPDVAPAR